jgi:cysteinyl-tRNA synthetase
LPEDTSVFKALLDDINTPEAIANLHLAASRLNKAKHPDEASSAKAELLAGGRLLGILESDPEAWFTEAIASGPALPSADKIESLIKERLTARQNRNFVRADEIREQLLEQGVLLEDGPEGTVWRRRH